MRLLLHLMRHDLRTNAPLASLWVLLVLSQVPVGFLVATDGLGRHAEAVGLGLPFVRLTVMVLLIAALVQADAPHDDRAFWPTRPVPRPLMTMAKLGLVAALCLALPLVVVLAVAAGLHVPVSRWPQVMLDVVAVDGLAVGLTLLVATVTRRISALLVGVLAICALAGLLIAAAQSLLDAPAVREVLGRGSRTTSGDVEATMVRIAACALWVMAAVPWLGGATRRAWPRAWPALAGLALVAIVGVLMVPRHDDREHDGRREGEPVRLARDYAWSAAGDAITLSVPLAAPPWPADASGTIGFGNAELQVGHLRRRRQETRQFIGRGQSPSLELLTLPRAEWEGLAGELLRVRGSVRVAVERPRPAGSLAMRIGERLEIRDTSLRYIGEAVAGSNRLGRLAVTWTDHRGGVFGWSTHDVFFIPGAGATPRRVAVTPAYPRWHVDGAMLPTLAAPFGYRQVALDAALPPGEVIPPGASDAGWLQLVMPLRTSTTVHEIDEQLVVPPLRDPGPPFPALPAK